MWGLCGWFEGRWFFKGFEGGFCLDWSWSGLFGGRGFCMGFGLEGFCMGRVFEGSVSKGSSVVPTWMSGV